MTSKATLLIQTIQSALDELAAIIDAPEPKKGVIGTGYSVTASEHDGNVPENVRDDDFTTRWSAKGAGQFLTIELPDLYEVDSVQIAVHEGDKRKQRFEILVSSDGQDYAKTGSFETSGKSRAFESFTFAPAEAKFLRIVGQMNSVNEWNSITGLRVNDPYAVNIPVPSTEPAPDPVPDTTGFRTIRKVSFENHPVGKYTDSMLKSDWGGGKLYEPNTTRIEKIEGSNRLVSHYPKGTWGRGGGLNQIVELKKFPGGDKVEEAELSYTICFQEGFDWALGGKLPGFGVGPVETLISGGRPMTQKGGATVRNMWYGDKMKNYIYAHGMKGPYGDTFGVAPAGKLIPGTAHRVTSRVKLNDLGKKNGIFEVKLDGKVILYTDKLELRVAGGPQYIEILSLVTFMGGSDKRFAPERDQFMWMDDIEIRVR